MTTIEKEQETTSQAQSHPLKCKWDWFYKPRIVYSQQSEKDWLSDYQKIYCFDTVEKFWKMYNNIPEWYNLGCGSMYALFKKDIKPSWEDEKNEGGFSWILYVSQRVPEQTSKDLYLNILLMLIGNTYEHPNLLNGCTFEKKARGDKIVFWFGNNRSETGENYVVDHKGFLKAIMSKVNLEDKDCHIMKAEEKIDWRGNELRHKKIAIRLIHHDTSAKIKAN